MKIHRPSTNRIFIAICCFTLIAACAPQRTGNIYREHRDLRTFPASGDDGYIRENAAVYPPRVNETEPGGRLLGDVEPEPEETKAEELKELELLGKWEQGKPAAEHTDEAVKYDFPVTVNRQVRYYLDFFTGKHRKNFAIWLARSGKYLPMIHEHLRAAGLPEDLAYLAMIESGFNERAYSRAKAVGVWQFIKSTGRNYGLAINSYVDERRNPVKSTKAAVSYLSDLYNEFGSWYLAVAAYNAGEGKIRRAVKKYKTRDFWEIAQGRYLKLETKRYVPKLIAAIIIAKEPEKYGFNNIAYQAPMAYDIVEVPRWTSIKAVALACNMDPKELKTYNNELRKGFSPPDRASYPFNVPAGKKGEVEKNLPRVQAIVSTGFKTHKVRKGETLSSICKKYGLTKTVVLKSNHLRSSGLQAGQRLRIPYQTTTYEMLPEGSVAKGYMAAASTEGNFILHKVRPGETVSELSRMYSVPIHLIAAWNDLDDISKIRAGQQMVFYVQSQGAEVAGVSPGSDTALAQLSSSGNKEAVGTETDLQQVQVKLAAVRAELHNSSSENSYVVRNGDTLWEIGRKFDLDLKELKRLNGLASNVIRPGDRLQVKASTKPAGSEYYYRVRKGDSLWNIARTHNVSPEDIISWNNLENSIIHPGNRLLIMLAAADEQSVDSYYQVRSGDSLWSIARNYNVTPEDIKRWNNLKDNTIHPGNRLLLKQDKGG
ncbi:MAG: LysM peptidoglycan-binding domain-containing protein [Deltaproteobacteria bacterium]|jgi:membrane-bound lytic murein transglycosylase D|nr:LysM peptidoglycan-binding domain-containing protein [Deltaproteobacteria bacterium]